MITALYVDKTDGTFADTLLAHGLARVARDVSRRLDGADGADVTVVDVGPYYRLDVLPGLDSGQLNELVTYAPDAPVIRTVKNAAQLPEILPAQAIVDYEVERDRRASYFEVRKSLSREARVALSRDDEHPELDRLRGLTPHTHWDVFRAINPAALSGYNKLVTQWWLIQEALPEVLHLIFDLFAGVPNDLEAAGRAWRKLDKAYGWGISPGATALQIYDPAQGKGQNRTKADRLSMGNMTTPVWLVEWLKAVGFYQAALTKQLQGTKDRKTYALRPVEISLRDSEAVMGAFREAMVGSQPSVRSDVVAALRYTKTLLRHSQRPDAADFAELLFARVQPVRIVAGFYTAFYKNLGNSAATMNLAFIGLPGWIRVSTPDDVDAALEILDEHERIVRQFEESHSDDVALLLSYRDFISGSDLWSFFDFTEAYAGYIIRKRERANGRAHQFSEFNLRRLVVSTEPKLRKILDTVGFQNVAYAIRQSTVVAQYRKQKGDRRYDVRYGLNQELARKANYPEDFVAALSEFMHKYNAENAQVMETRAGPYRRSLVMTDVEDIVTLVDEYGSEVVCQLLLAFGYARTPRKDGAEDQETEA